MFTGQPFRPLTSWQNGILLNKIRPQIFLALLMLGLITGYAINVGMVEVATGTIGGMVALGMKVLEND